MIFSAVARSTPRTAARETVAMLASNPLPIAAQHGAGDARCQAARLVRSRTGCYFAAMAQALSGPHLLPRSGKPQQLVLLLHGYGADGSDLIGLAPQWAPLLPQAEFLSPDAPFPCEG